MSTLVVTNISDGTTSVPSTSVTNGSAKVWGNFNGTGTVAFRDSYNASSITDNGTGNYTPNHTNNMADGNYAALNSAKGEDNQTVSSGNNPRPCACALLTTSNFRYMGATTASTTVDAVINFYGCLGDLA